MRTSGPLKFASFVLSVIPFLSFTQNSATPLDSALVACYPFSGNANDASGHNNNGTVNGAVLVNDRFNNPNSAYSFNGNNQNILVPNFNSQVTSNDFSISFWSAASAYATRSAIILVPDDPSNRLNIHIYYGNNSGNSQTFWDFGDIFSNGRLLQMPSLIPPTNGWDHWVFVTSLSKGFMKVYCNNVLIANKTGSSGFVNTYTKDLLIGGGFGFNGAYLWFDGKLDDLKFYNRELLPNHVSQLYTNPFTCMSCPNPTVTNVTPSNNLSICTGISTTLNAVGNGTVQWYASLTSTSAIGAGTIFATPVLTAGSHTYYVVSTTSCATSSSAAAIMVTVNPSPSLSIAVSQNTVCFGEKVILTGKGASTYSWSGMGSNSTLQVTPSLGSNVYTLTGFSTAGCKSTLTVQVFASACTGLSDQRNDVGFVIYPNPARTELLVYSPIASSSTILFYDAGGRLIAEKILSGFETILNIGDLSKGIYFVRQKLNNQVSDPRKLVIE